MVSSVLCVNRINRTFNLLVWGRLRSRCRCWRWCSSPSSRVCRRGCCSGCCSGAWSSLCCRVGGCGGLRILRSSLTRKHVGESNIGGNLSALSCPVLHLGSYLRVGSLNGLSSRIYSKRRLLLSNLRLVGSIGLSLCFRGIGINSRAYLRYGVFRWC